MSRIAARTAARTATRIVTRIVTGLFALALLAAPATPAAAQSFQQGLAAAERGDYAAALREWRPLAEAGDAYAQASLAALHVRGHGVPVDIAEALKWFRLAAAQGLSAAQFNLGQLLSNPNTGSLRDVGEAMIWYGRAAEQGNAAAHYKLGLLHANGGPGPQDLARTFMHWTIADTLGFAEAARQLDGLRALISAAQTADGKRQAADWMAAYKVRSGETARLRDAQAESESEIDRLRGTLAARTAEAAALRQQIVEMDSAVAGLRAEIAARKTARKAALAAVKCIRSKGRCFSAPPTGSRNFSTPATIPISSSSIFSTVASSINPRFRPSKRWRGATKRLERRCSFAIYRMTATSF